MFITLLHAPRGDEESCDGAQRRRQMARSAGGVARAPERSASRVHILGLIPAEPGAARTESVASWISGRPETRRGVAARPGRVRQMRLSHDDAIQDGQETELLLRRAFASGPERALRAYLGGDARRPGRAGSAPRVGARRTGPQPARHRGRRARAPAPPRPVAPDTR